MAVVGTMLLAFGNGAASYAERTLPSGLVALLIASVPLWMALADRVINGRRLRPVAWAALLIGLTGIAILARPHGNGTVLPVIVVLAGAMSWGIGSVLAGSAINPFVMDAWQAPIAYGRLCALMNIGGPRRAARRPARVTARVRRKTRLMTIIMVMTMTIPLADAKARLSAVLDEVRDTHERVVITRNGRPEAVLISVSDLEALEDTLDLLSTPGALDEIQAAEAEIARGEAVGADELRRLMAERTRAEQGGE
jgi:prevent-host-death family protein